MYVSRNCWPSYTNNHNITFEVKNLVISIKTSYSFDSLIKAKINPPNNYDLVNNNKAN